MLTFEQALDLAIQLSMILTCWVIIGIILALFFGRIARLSHNPQAPTQKTPPKTTEFIR